MNMNSRVMWNLARKDWLLLLRDKAALFFTFGFPLIIAVFFGTAFSGGGQTATIPLAVTDLDNSSQSREWIAGLQETDALNITLLPEDKAREQVRKGAQNAMLVIPPGFGRAREQLFDPEIPEVRLVVSPGSKATRQMLEGMLMARAAKDMQQLMSDTDAMLANLNDNIAQLDDELQEGLPEDARVFFNKLREMLTALKQLETSKTADNGRDNMAGFQGFTPLLIRHDEIHRDAREPQNTYAISFPQGMVWGILGVISTFALTLVSEVRQGTMARLMSMPLGHGDVLGGKALGCFFSLVAVMSLLLALGMLFFGIRVQNPAVLLIAIFSSALGFTGLMLLLSVLGKTEKSASGLSWAVLMVLAMTGGGMIPLFVMPRWMANLGQFSPVQWTVLSFEGALWREFSVAEVLPYASLLVLLGVGGMLLGGWLFKRRIHY
jgi:ABC-2 type transport system permease protein